MYNGQNTCLKKTNKTPNFGPWHSVILAFRMKSPKQLIWMEMGVLIARVFGMVSLDKTPQTIFPLGCGTAWEPECMHGTFSQAISNDSGKIFQPLQKYVRKTVLHGHFCVCKQVSTSCFHMAYLQIIGSIPQ